MPKIIINEADFTSELVATDLTNAVYIPGFSINPIAGEEAKYELGVPTLYTDVDAFVEAIGDRPFYFGTDSKVSDWNSNLFYSEFNIVIYDSNYYVAKSSNIGWTVVVPTSWVSGTTYTKGDIVYVSSVYYRALNDIEESTTSPEEDTENWEVVVIREYDATSTYVAGDVVSTNDTLYSKDEIITPSNDTTNWATNKVDTWDDDPTYDKYTMVSYQNSIFASKTMDNKGNVPTNATYWSTNQEISGAGKYADYDVDVECDVAYIYAKTLLGLGLPIYYEVVKSITGGKCSTVESLYQRFVKTNDIESIFTNLSDKGSYSIKYITSGGYPIYKGSSTYTIMQDMMFAAAERADACALIDHVQGLSADPSVATNPYKTINAIGDSVFAHNTSWSTTPIDCGSYAAMFTPWANYIFTERYEMGQDTNNYANEFELPASFAYLVCLANAIKNNPDWLAIAGVTRGKVAYIDQKGEKPIVTNKMADAYMTEGGSVANSGRSINGITNIRPYGLTIWGNRTLVNNTSDRPTPALAYLNTRNMVSDVKKVVFEAAQKHMFEQNNDVLWINFKSDITPLLDRLSTSGGISGYKIIKQKSKTSAKLCATIILYPIYAVEEIEVSIELRNEDITVA